MVMIDLTVNFGKEVEAAEGLECITASSRLVGRPC